LSQIKKITVNGKLFSVEVLERMPGAVTFQTEGRKYLVEWPQELASQEPVTAASKTGSSGQEKALTKGTSVAKNGAPGMVSAPMPGVVVEIMVEQGQKVEAGQALISLEAMKMENQIYSPSAGTISDIFVKEGEEVMDGQELLKLGPEKAS